MSDRSPVITQDPRFLAGRTLIERSLCEQAIEVFATLLEETRRTYGDEHIETAPAYYEYGNAILRSSQQQEQQQQPNEDINEPNSEVDDKMRKMSREVLAAAADRRATGGALSTASVVIDEGAREVGSSTEKNQKNRTLAGEKSNKEKEKEDSEEKEDVELSLEMMETAWSIVDNYLERPSSFVQNYLTWAKEQSPRYITGIGDVLSAMNRHADAADAYCRALAHRQNDVAELGQDDSMTYSIKFLQCRRRLVEANVLIAEELLACPPGEDVITTESKDKLVSAAERVDYARGYYDKARDELQETVLLMGEMVAKGKDVTEEKENICFVSTMVMGVGMLLAELDEQMAAGAPDVKEPRKKKAKRK